MRTGILTLQDKQGSVKKIYKGILFLCDESEQENNGYICVKAQLCEKINISGDASKEKVCMFGTRRT